MVNILLDHRVKFIKLSKFCFTNAKTEKKRNCETTFKTLFNEWNTNIWKPDKKKWKVSLQQENSPWTGEGKRRNEFAQWHVAWLAKWHYYAECNIWKMAQRYKLNRKACARLCRALFWRQFEWATAFSFHLLLLAQTNKAEQKEAGNLYCIRVYVRLN